MRSLLNILGIREFPWSTVAVWSALGLIIALMVTTFFWGKTDGGKIVLFKYGLLGILIGGILGLFYHALVEVCHMTLSS